MDEMKMDSDHDESNIGIKRKVDMASIYVSAKNKTRKNDSMAHVQRTCSGLFEITKMKGNFWKQMGYSQNGKNYLYPEECLDLIEKRQLLLAVGDSILSVKEAYELIISAIGLPCYLTYVKLKVIHSSIKVTLIIKLLTCYRNCNISSQDINL